MRHSLGIWTSAILVLVILGCTGQNTGSWSMTTAKDGVVTNTVMVEAPEARDLPQDSYAVTIKDGKLSWWVRIQNLEPLRKKYIGQFSVHTLNPRGVAFVKFEGTVDGGKTETFKQDNVVVDGLTKESDVLKINALLIPGAGCVTCTCATQCNGTKCKGTPANWPVIALAVQPIKLDLASNVKEIVIPAPDFEVAIIGVEINEKGGRKFFWNLTAKNNEPVAVNIQVTVFWSFDTGEKVLPKPIEFVLQGNETRLIAGAPVGTEKAFREVNGKVKLTKKTYVK